MFFIRKKFFQASFADDSVLVISLGSSPRGWRRGWCRSSWAWWAGWGSKVGWSAGSRSRCRHCAAGGPARPDPPSRSAAARPAPRPDLHHTPGYSQLAPTWPETSRKANRVSVLSNFSVKPCLPGVAMLGVAVGGAKFESIFVTGEGFWSLL